MKKSILLLSISMLLANLTFAQFQCQISPLLKEAGELMGKKYSHVKDVSIVGDYRDNGSGWVLLPDHTGAYFIQNVQSSEFMWTLYEQPKGLCLGIVVFKNTLSDDGKRQIEKKSAFYINFVSKNDIELLDSETFLNLKMHKRILTD